MAVSISAMIRVVIFLFLIGWIPTNAKVVDCESIVNEIKVFKSFSPAAISLYKNDLLECGIEYINGVPLTDYFKIEKDVLLAYTYVSFKNKMTHDLLINYMIFNERWDLLLRTLDSSRKMKQSNQVLLLHKLFYENLPTFFSSEMKEMFNFFTKSEKLTVSQQLIPNNPQEIKHLNKRNNYIYEFWPLFDQMVFINHLRQFYPYQFEKLAVFWRQKLVSYYYSDVEKQDPSFKLLFILLNSEVQSAPIKGANKSLQAYYYLKTNQFKLLNPMIARDKSIYFNLLRYFDLYTPQQQLALLNNKLTLTISDIEYLFESYFYQIDSLSFRSWIWDNAIKLKFNLEQYFNEPEQYISSLPVSKLNQMKLLSPVTNWVNLDQKSIQHYFDNDPTNRQFKSKLSKQEISNISRFYNDFKAMPFKDTSKVIRHILPYISIDSHEEFLELMPHITKIDQLNLIQRFDFLETMPTPNRAEWARKISPSFL